MNCCPRRLFIFMVFTAYLFFQISGSAICNSDFPIRDLWEKYISCETLEEAKQYVESNSFGLYYYLLPPNSAFSKEVDFLSEEIFQECGRLFLRVSGYKFWIPVKRNNKKWVFTMDERSLLDELTKNWYKEKIGSIQYYSDHKMTQKERFHGHLLSDVVKYYEKLWGIKVNDIRYYLADEPENAVNIVDETNPGAGKSRYRTIKAVRTSFHSHELAHLFALEIGFVNPFIDEGIANYLGSEPKIRDIKDVEELLEYTNLGYEKFLNGAAFFNEHVKKRKNIYGLSQLVMKYWVEKFGFSKIKDLLRQGVVDPGKIEVLIPNVLEPFARTNCGIKEILIKMRDDPYFMKLYFRNNPVVHPK